VKPKPLPVLTIIVGLVTAAVSIAALAHPQLRLLLERRPVPGELWASWRLVTSLVVHDGWLPLLFNLAGLAVVGPPVERRVGPARWASLYLLGGIVGQLFGLRWQPIGAGNSVASFGLIGGLVALSLRPGRGTHDAPAGLVLLYAVDWVVVYAGLELGGSIGAVIAGGLTVPLGMAFAWARTREPSYAPRLAAFVTLIVAVLLCASRDIHGPPLIAGAIAATLLPPSGTGSSAATAQ
jgi:membrane associated rhomboid family serine protease